MNYGRLWGQIPNTAGQVFWVAPSDGYTVGGNAYRASNDNSGLLPEQALRTVNRAWALATANAGDVIVLLPGTHTPTASIAASVAGVTMMGLPGGAGNYLRQKATIAAVTGDETMNITAAGIEIAYLNVIPVTAQEAIDVTAVAGVHIHHCMIDMNTPAVSTSTVGIAAIGAATELLIDSCYFNCDGAQGNAIVATATLDSVISNCLFSLSAGTWASAILCGAATDRLLVARDTFSCAGTAITVGVNGTGATLATGVLCHDNRFSSLVTVPIDGFDAAECEISENYDAGVGAADGGVLITAIT
jgi:hypothetical protein